MVHLSKVFFALAAVADGSFVDLKSASRRRGGPQVLTRGQQLQVSADAAKEMAESKHYLLQALWEGRDLPDNKFQIDDFADGDFAKGRNNKNVAVFGLQNSGVSLLNSILYTNFGHRLNYYSADFNGGRNFNTGFWKHANFKELAKEKDQSSLQYYEDNAITTITVVRDPYSWLSAMRTDGNTESPIAECAAGDDWLERSCNHPQPGGPKRRIQPVPYQSLMGVWNHFNEGYLRAQQYGFRRNLVVTYENLIHNPHSFLDRLAKALDIHHEGLWSFPLDSEKSEERLAARESVDTKKYLSTFAGGERQKACFSLDADVQDFMKYGKYDCSKFDAGQGKLKK